MGWKDLLEPEGGDTRVLPWTGGREICDRDRVWVIQGKMPNEHGWYSFSLTGGRKASLLGLADPVSGFDEGRPCIRGYLVGDRLISDDACIPDPDRLIEQTWPVFLVEPGLEQFTRALVIRHGKGLIYIRQEFPLGPEGDVLAAYLDRKVSVAGIPQVTPALDLAFRWVSLQRDRAEERRRELQRLREEEARQRALEERRRKAMKSLGTGIGRRAVAEVDFETAARASLAISGAELLACRESRARGEMIVQYRFQNRRLECVVESRTLRIVDAGVCLDDHHGNKGDTWFTLESLPAVIREAINRRKLVIWRHVAGDTPEDDEHGDQEDWDD